MKQKRKTSQPEEIGIRELKSRASEVVRAVKEERARYVITQRGKPVAAIVPLETLPSRLSEDETWERLTELGEEISQGWRSKKSAVDILSEMRR